MKRLRPLTLERISELLRVDIERGACFWKAPPKNHSEKLGRAAGGIRVGRCHKNYWMISVDGIQYKRSYIVFLAATGRWPKDILDHINGDSLNDAFSNLREATQAQNCRNIKRKTKKSPLPMGIRVQCGRYHARIRFNRKGMSIGTFDDLESAVKAYKEKRKELFGDFA